MDGQRARARQSAGSSAAFSGRLRARPSLSAGFSSERASTLRAYAWGPQFGWPAAGARAAGQAGAGWRAGGRTSRRAGERAAKVPSCQTGEPPCRLINALGTLERPRLQRARWHSEIYSRWPRDPTPGRPKHRADASVVPLSPRPNWTGGTRGGNQTAGSKRGGGARGSELKSRGAGGPGCSVSLIG